VPPKDPSLRLHDIAEAIDRIFEYTAGDLRPLREAIGVTSRQAD
jgi:uncharacterized protein with HEPN domain